MRCFEDQNIVHVRRPYRPGRRCGYDQYELLLSDMEILERRIQRTAKAAKADKKIQPELDLLQRVYEWLGEGKNARGNGS